MSSTFTEGNLPVGPSSGDQATQPSFSMGSRNSGSKSSKKSKVSRSPDNLASVPQPPIPNGDMMSMYPEQFEQYTTVKLTDVLPLILCAGILALLFFMIREWHSDRENTSAQMKSIDKRMEQLENLLTSTPPKVLPPNVPPSAVWASHTPAVTAAGNKEGQGDDESDGDAEPALTPNAGGTYVLDGDTVSYNPKGNQVVEGEDSSDSENEDVPVTRVTTPNLQSIDESSESDDEGEEDGAFS